MNLSYKIITIVPLSSVVGLQLQPIEAASTVPPPVHLRCSIAGDLFYSGHHTLGYCRRLLRECRIQPRPYFPVTTFLTLSPGSSETTHSSFIFLSGSKPLNLFSTSSFIFPFNLISF